jgi:NifU-like protein involved in Fe-S cluster formation
MKTWMFALVALAIAGCGVETASTAVTAASLKKQELEEGKKTQARAQQKIDEATKLMQQRAAHAGDDTTR